MPRPRPVRTCIEAFGETLLEPGKYVWRDVPASAGRRAPGCQPRRPAGLPLSRRHFGCGVDHFQRQADRQ